MHDAEIANGQRHNAGRRQTLEVDFKQLRHQTKNALQQLLCEVMRTPILRRDAEVRAAMDELERRIRISAKISDSLFGLTRAPGTMTERLTALGRNVVALYAAPAQDVRLDVLVEGVCPPSAEETVLRVAHEFLGNAMKHGLRERTHGRILVQLTRGHARTSLSVEDDGRGLSPLCASGQAWGEGLKVARELALLAGGCITLKHDRRTIATLDLPVRCGEGWPREA